MWKIVSDDNEASRFMSRARQSPTFFSHFVSTAYIQYPQTGKWTQFAVPVHFQYPHLLAEMFAYCLAAAHLGLAHQTAASFMVSETSVGPRGEGWGYIDKMKEEAVCEKQDPENVPNVIHFCQRYGLGKWFFGKYRMPKDMLTCESPLFEEPPQNISAYRHADFPGGEKKVWNEQQAKRNAFMLCNLLPGLNAAIEYFKRNHCDGKANFNRTLSF
jgi:hypothetical protein